MRANIQLYNEDCMPALEAMTDNQFDLAIVDPPYGISVGKKNGKIGYDSDVKEAKKYRLFDDSQVPLQVYFDNLKRVSKNQIIWGANYFPNLVGGAVIWNKCRPKGCTLSHCEIAYSSLHNATYIYHYMWHGYFQEDRKNQHERIHPTQKPVALYKWLLDRYAKPGDKILDTFLGSGSIAIACWDMRYDLVGYEIDKDYYDDAVARLERHQQQGWLL